MKVQPGARYDLFGERLIAVEWESDDTADWLLLHDAGTDEPRYRVLTNGTLERCHLALQNELRGGTCDFTVDDLRLAVLPLKRNDT